MRFGVRELTTDEDFAACVELQEAVWGRGFSERVPAALLRVSLRVGAVLAGAFDESGRLIGHVFGLTGVRDGRVIHWSEMLAVHPDARDRGVGEALKRHQRRVLLERGVTLAEWTFDPLESRNAHLNFARLGCTAHEYIRDFYGSSVSPLHTGLSTDRLIVTWVMHSERVERRLAGTTSPPAFDELKRVPVINPVRTEHGMMVCDDARLDLDAPRLLLAIPADIQHIKASGPAAALRWRSVTRAALESYLPRGFTVTELVRSGAWSAYLLER